MRRLAVCLIPFAILAVSGCNNGQGYGANVSPDLDARLAASDRCEARGLKIPSKEYSDCFFAEFHSSSATGVEVASSPNEIPPQLDESSPAAPPTEGGPTAQIAMQRLGGTYIVPVSINGRLTLDFVVDSGASDVSVPADVVLTLIRTGTVGAADFVGHQNYRLADGTVAPSMTFRIRDLEVGGHDVRNVLASIAPVSGTLLLGQSFLGRFKSWSIDNHRHVLLLN